MRDLVPELPRRPAQLMYNAVDPCDLAPAARAALQAEQLLQPLVLSTSTGWDWIVSWAVVLGMPPGFELLRAQQVQEVLLLLALDPLIRV